MKESIERISDSMASLDPLGTAKTRKGRASNDLRAGWQSGWSILAAKMTHQSTTCTHPILHNQILCPKG
jgi:hypothetical protein